MSATLRPAIRVLLAAALVAAGLAAAAAPVGADPGVADAALAAGANPACPDPEDVARQTAARFRDIDVDHTHAANIGCLVYYGITGGAGDGSYFDPDRVVNRWQMALFMTRAAQRAGVAVPGGDQGFTDLDGLSSSIRAGVNAAAALGIMPGTSTDEFSPDSPVARADMALFLVRLLDLITDEDSPINVTVDGATGTVSMTRRDGGSVTPDDSFEDVASQVSPAQEHAINAIYELGVTTGKSRDIYDPGGSVKRAHMAAFIVRMLGHSNLRANGPIILEAWMPPAPKPLPADPDGVYSGDPLHLIAYASFDRAYSLPDGGEDRFEVWLCNTPQSGQRYSTHADNRHNPGNYADKFASQVTHWFEWLSGARYRPVFVAGGVVEVGWSDDYYRACDEAVRAQDFTGRPEIDGAVVVVGTEIVDHGLVGMASCGFFSQRGFPANGRSVLVNGDAFSDPTLLAHELGHALCWPHSYSGETLDDDGEIFEYDNLMDIMGWPVAGEPDPVPLVGTPAINRYAAGWIPIEQVRVHKLGTTARYQLVPAGEDGVQLLVVPYSNDSRVRFLALGARVKESGGNWGADTGLPAEGVEIYYVDQSVFGCDLPDRGFCYGLYRRTQPEFDPDVGYDPHDATHVMADVGEGWTRGEVGDSASVLIELVAVDGDTFAVEVRPYVQKPEPESLSDWWVRTGSRTAGDYVYADTSVNIGSDSSPVWLWLAIRCTSRQELDVFIQTSRSYFSGTPTLEYRFGSQTSPTSLSMLASTSNEAGFLLDDDLTAFVEQLRADTSGVLYIELWDAPTYGGSYWHEAGGVLGVAGVEADVEPVLRECGY